MSGHEMSLPERLRSWAQNEEMIDTMYTVHGDDCNEAAEFIEELAEENARLTAENEQLKKDRAVWKSNAEQIALECDRLMADARELYGALEHAAGETDSLVEHYAENADELRDRYAPKIATRKSDAPQPETRKPT